MPLDATILYYNDVGALTPSQQRVEYAKSIVVALWTERIDEVMTTVAYHDLFYRSCAILALAGVLPGQIAVMTLALLHLADANRGAV